MLKEVVNTKERCPRCGRGKLVTDTESGELFCSKCGFVMSEKLQESGPEWRSFTQDEHGDRARAGAPTSLTMHDMGLATIIDPVDRNFRQAFSELNRLKDKLAISDAVIEKAAYIYRKALDKGLVRGRSISALMAAALYAACRDTATPRNLKDIEIAANIKRKDIARCYRLLVKELDLKMPVTDSIQCVARIASVIGIAEKTKRYAIKVLQDAQKNEVSAGKDPMGLAAAALYLSCVKNGEDKTQRDIAEAANVTEVTIRNRYKGLKDSLTI